MAQVYPNGYFIEFHFSGFNPQFEGIDWESLKLVFEAIIPARKSSKLNPIEVRTVLSIFNMRYTIYKNFNTSDTTF